MGNIALTRTERRSLGRFDTPRPLAQAITDWAVKDRSDLVLEPSAGGGAIVQSIASRLKELGANQVGNQIVACDVDPRALAETAHCLEGNLPSLVLGNFLELDEMRVGGQLFDAVVGNPPYVRLHTMDFAARKAARRCLPEGELLGAKASLWAYFPIHAFKFIKEGGRMAWILPETLLHSDYGKQLLRWSAKNFARCIAVSLRERCFEGAGAKERVVILLLEGAGKSAVREIEMVEYDNAIDCIAALSSMALKNNDQLPQLNGHAVPHLISTEAADAAATLEECDGFVRLGDLADIRIGVVTGDNRFFVLSEEQRASAKLRRHHFQPVVSKFADLGPGLEFEQPAIGHNQNEQALRVLLLCPSPVSTDKNLAAHLSTYSKESIKANRTMQKRVHWQCPALGQIPDAFLRSMGKAGPRLVLNRGSSYCTNTIHSLFFKEGITKAKQQAICLAMHSTYTQLSAEFEGRQYGSGVLKLEPSEAKRLTVPGDPAVLGALEKQWKVLSKKATCDGWESIVDDIDNIILSYAASLSSALPLQRAKAILHRVRQRRTSTFALVMGKGLQ